MKRAASAALLVAVVIAIVLYLRRGHDDMPAPPPSPGSGSAAVPTGSGAAASIPTPDRVRRISAAERKQLGEQIAAARAKARAAAAATSTGGAPALPDDSIPLETVAADLRKPLQDAIPFLAECYEKRFGSAVANRTAVVQMQMTSDPAFGTVIDTPMLTDEGGAPLDPAIDDCLRTTIEELALPPMRVGGTLLIKYSFQFGD